MSKASHLLACLGTLVVLPACGREREGARPAPRATLTAVESSTAAQLVLAPASVEQRLPRVPRDLAWLAFGGGSDPLSNQVSLAQDLELASSVLGGRGFTMFASGAGAQLAVERGDATGPDPHEDVTAALARLFGRRGRARALQAPRCRRCAATRDT